MAISADAAEAKADDLVARAEKKLTGFSLFTSKAQKEEDACELLDKAAAQYKIGKHWERAAATYVRCAEMSERGGSAHQAATYYVNAAKAYKNVSAKDAVKTYQFAVDMHMENNRFSTAAKLYKEIAALWEAEMDVAAAMTAWRAAADCYEGEDSTTSANQCLLKVAHHAAAQEDFATAVEIYEKVANASLGNNLTKWSCKDYFFKALLCQLCVCARKDDMDAVDAALEKYKDLLPSFEQQRECKLVDALVEAWKQDDVDAFTEAVFKFNQITVLDNWTATILLEVKRALKGEGPAGGGGGGGDGDGSGSDDELDMT